MTIVAGIDVGSTYTKAVLSKEDGTIVGSVMLPTGFRIPEVAEKVFHLRFDLGLSSDHLASYASVDYCSADVLPADIRPEFKGQGVAT